MGTTPSSSNNKLISLIAYSFLDNAIRYFDELINIVANFPIYSNFILHDVNVDGYWTEETTTEGSSFLKRFNIIVHIFDPLELLLTFSQIHIRSWGILKNSTNLLFLLIFRIQNYGGVISEIHFPRANKIIYTYTKFLFSQNCLELLPSFFLLLKRREIESNIRED